MIELTGVSKFFGDFQALKSVSLSVQQGERVVVCGPSGSGKSTMIRCINRLEEHNGGTITVNGIELTDDLEDVTSVRREVGMVFQQFNLFPHLTVLQNLTLAPMKAKRTTGRKLKSWGCSTLSGYTFRSRRRSTPGSYPVASSNASRSHAVCVCNRRSCCLTSLLCVRPRNDQRGA